MNAQPQWRYRRGEPKPQKRNGRPLACNLIRDGFEEAAERVAHVIARDRGGCVVQVEPDGGVRVKRLSLFAPDEYHAVVQQPTYIGTFDRRARVEHIEDELLQRQREIAGGFRG